MQQKNSEREKENNMLSPSEIKKLFEVCDNPRDRCILAVMYEGAFRKDEVLYMQLKDFAQILDRTAKKAGITKKVHPHLLRQSRLNQLVKEGVNERELRTFAGWD